MRTMHMVEAILRHNPTARNSDKHLFVEFMQSHGLNLTQPQIDKFMDMPSLESVRRIRQKLQEQGKYRATDRVRQFRKIKELVIQQNMPQSSPERTNKLFDDTNYELRSTRNDPFRS